MESNHRVPKMKEEYLDRLIKTSFLISGLSPTVDIDRSRDAHVTCDVQLAGRRLSLTPPRYCVDVSARVTPSFFETFLTV